MAGELIAVILAGGLGTRMGRETEFRPKPMVEVGNEPIIWHLIKFLEAQGFEEFIVAGGYKVEVIQEYFESSSLKFNKNTKIKVVDTGTDTLTGERLLKLKKYIEHEENFLCTYGDGLSDLRVEDLINFHLSHGAVATVTGIRPISRFGVFQGVTDLGQILNFQEKPKESSYVNGGFFIFQSIVFKYLQKGMPLEGEPLSNLVRDSNLFCYKHDGFWKSMDTYRENRELHEMWMEGNAPWKIW